MTRVLVCGGRDFTDADLMWDELFCFLDKHKYPELTIISGMAKGADSLAADWAKQYGVNLEEYHADWEKHGRAAGPIRNQQMLDEGKPNLVIAFPGGRGTAHMVKIAKAKGIEVIEITV